MDSCKLSSRWSYRDRKTGQPDLPISPNYPGHLNWFASFAHSMWPSIPTKLLCRTNREHMCLYSEVNGTSSVPRSAISKGEEGPTLIYTVWHRIVSKEPYTRKPGVRQPEEIDILRIMSEVQLEFQSEAWIKTSAVSLSLERIQAEGTGTQQDIFYDFVLEWIWCMRAFVDLLYWILTVSDKCTHGYIVAIESIYQMHQKLCP